MHAFARNHPQVHFRPVDRGTGPDWPKLLLALQRKLNVRQKDLAPILGVNQSTVTRWMSGKMQVEKPEHIARIMAVLRQHGIKFVANPTDSHIIAIIGRVHSTAEVELIFNENTSIVPHESWGVAPMVDGSTADTVALVVEGGSMAPMFDAGWILYYDNNETPPTEDIIGQLAVVKTRDGRILVRKLALGTKPGFWMLVTPGGQWERDVEVEWAEVIFNVTLRRPRH